MSDLAVYRVAFHINGTERTGGAQVLACAAANATLGIDYGYFGRICMLWVAGHHLDCTCGAVSGTVSALYPVGQGYAILPHPYGMSYLGGRFVCYGKQPYGTGRTDFAALVALRPAVAPFV